MSDKLTYSVNEVAALLGVSRTVAYRLANTPGFPAISVGKRKIIPVVALNRWLDEQAQQG